MSDEVRSIEAWRTAAAASLERSLERRTAAPRRRRRARVAALSLLVLAAVAVLAVLALTR